MKTGLGEVDDLCLQIVLDIISDGVWDWHANTGYVYRSPGWFRMLGYNAASLPASVASWEQNLHPDDHQRVLAHFDNYIHNHSSSYQIEYRLKKADNSYLWVEDRARIIEWNDDGSVARMIGAHRDINERKLNLDRLAQQNHSLEDLVEERTHQLIQTNAELESKIAEVQRLAETDTLTGVANRYRLEKTLELEVERAERFKQPLSIIALDIDDFKIVNDEFGHANGDMVLVQMSRLLKKNIREIDLLARWGGDEFMILLPNTGLEAAAHTAEKLRQLIMDAKLDKRATITTSFGVAQLRQGESAMRLSIRADNALYQSKDSGKNRISS
ncbi:MAG: sensor domain-containing diguanylate cyclase [Methylophaga sp.]|uniref:sensor domain-containing diguanylate cyclase n=1 Tax=Methylophaga sp. TaxID=2024840 RepID=UPI00299EB52C|nr:sensor domain-containing diguanylate cyclase [Methylophaga sp.]MDX1749425.1 sensor domain-containing diguanylate cyclase [Methylophaga sp.]